MSPTGRCRTVSYGGTDYALHTFCATSRPEATVIALHGFTGTGLDWVPLFGASDRPWLWICPDLPGHGQTLCPLMADYFRLDRIVSFIEALRQENRNQPVYLIGYSMGGRIALHYLRHRGPLPTCVIGAHPGIESPGARLERARLDDSRIPRGTSIEAFCEAWEQLPLIAPQRRLREPLRGEVSRRRRSQNVAGLRMALRTLSPGRIPPLWNALPDMAPFVFVHGEQDPAYAEVAKRIQSAQPSCTCIEVPGAGHAVHLECPTALAELLAAWIR